MFHQEMSLKRVEVFLFFCRENPLTLAGEKGHVELVSLLLSRSVYTTISHTHLFFFCTMNAVNLSKNPVDDVQFWERESSTL